MSMKTIPSIKMAGQQFWENKIGLLKEERSYLFAFIESQMVDFQKDNKRKRNYTISEAKK